MYGMPVCIVLRGGCTVLCGIKIVSLYHDSLYHFNPVSA